MSRTKLSIVSQFRNFCRAIGQEADTSLNTDGISALQTASLLRHFNEGHRRAYESNEWEDAWEDGTLTPSSGVIAYSAITDAARFVLFSEDPRPVTSNAYAVHGITSADGIQVQTDAGTVFGFWLPKVSDFTDSTATTLAILESIAPAVIDLAVAEYQAASGKPQTAAIWEAKGLLKLEARWCVEFQRVQRAWWLRNRYN